MAIGYGVELAQRPAAKSQPKVSLARQVAIVLGAVTAYFLVRGATEGSVTQAVRNAGHVVGFERLFGFNVEESLQDAVAGWPYVTTVLNWVYIYGHWPVIAVTLIWLARRHPLVYYRTRNAMLISGAVGLVVFISFPVAPPRLAGLGMVDTVTEQSHAYRVLQPAMFTNQYAAMPSLHVGWDLLIGLAIFVAARHTLVRAIGVAMPVAMATAVVLTANHYIIDAVVGATLTTTCWVLCGYLRRRSVLLGEDRAPAWGQHGPADGQRQRRGHNGHAARGVEGEGVRAEAVPDRTGGGGRHRGAQLVRGEHPAEHHRRRGAELLPAQRDRRWHGGHPVQPVEEYEDEHARVWRGGEQVRQHQQRQAA
jgi:PAP2 superfamily